MGPDWSLLPPELLQLISEKITSMNHYVHFRFVCQAWQLACPPRPHHLIPRIPWFLGDLRETVFKHGDKSDRSGNNIPWVTVKKSLYDNSNLKLRTFEVFGLRETGFNHGDKSDRSENNVPSVTLSLYDYSNSKMHKFEFPGVRRYEVKGHSHGWIVFLKDNELSFINPITRKRKNGCFPSLAVPPTVLEFAGKVKKKRAYSEDDSEEEYICISKIVLTSSPSDKDCIAVAEFVGCEYELGFARIGDTCWTILKRPDCGRVKRRMSDFKCRNELVYVINDKGCLTVYNLRDLSKKIIIDSLSRVNGDHHLRLVIGEGELDGVPLVLKHGRTLNPRSKLFEVYKCVNGPMMSQWMRVKNIGNFVLLLSRRTCEIISLENVEMDGWEGNHIYYDTESRKNGRSYSDFNIRMVSIEKGIVEPTSLRVFHHRTIESCPWFRPRWY